VTDAEPTPTSARSTPHERSLAGFERSGIDYAITEHGPVNSLEEAAAARGVQPRDVIKTIVVRISEGNYIFVLIGGDRQIDWTKLRHHLGVSRLHMPSADEAFEATGFVRGTITPFGALRAWPVIADSHIVDRTVSIGAGDHGVAATVRANDVIEALGAQVADVSE